MSTPATVNELCDHIEAWARDYYRRADGTQTGEATQIMYALRALRRVAGDQPPASISADTLYECRQSMLDGRISRKVINARVRKIRNMLWWAADPPNRWITRDQLADLDLVRPLKAGRSEAPEHGPVKPVPWELASETIACAALPLATMIEVQWWGAMRPCELVGMRRSMIREEQDLLIIRLNPEEEPEAGQHKAAHHGRTRTIYFGPNGQAVLRPWLARLDADADRLWPYTRTSSYYNAIRRVNQRHGIAHWHPNQIRHAGGTRFRAEAGLDAAQGILGHSQRSTTEIYAEPDDAAAREAARKFG